MTKSALKYIVITLSILIILAFIAIIYGIYLKTSNDNKFSLKNANKLSLNLEINEKIQDIQVIDKDTLLILIKNSGVIKAGIYNLKSKKIINYIEK